MRPNSLVPRQGLPEVETDKNVTSEKVKERYRQEMDKKDMPLLQLARCLVSASEPSRKQKYFSSKSKTHSFSANVKKGFWPLCSCWQLFALSLPLNLSSVLQDGFVQLQQVGDVHPTNKAAY